MQNPGTTFMAKCNENIKFENIEIPLREITYVESFYEAQFSVMKFIGLSGMIVNKIFLSTYVFIEGKNRKFSIN